MVELIWKESLGNIIPQKNRLGLIDPFEGKKVGLICAFPNPELQ